MRLETNRLVLRPLTHDDLDALAPFYSDPDVMRFIGSGRTLTREEARESVAAMIERYDRDGFGQLAAVRKEDGRVLGRVGFLVWDTETWTPTTLVDSHGAPEIELGWKLGREFWGRGYATEAALAVRDHGFADLDFPRLISLIDPRNAASIRVAEKLGMTREREVELRNGTALLYTAARLR